MPRVLNIDVRSGSDESFPYWHRPQPILTAYRLDPHFDRLRAAFPDTWQQLLALKKSTDAYTVLCDSSDPAHVAQSADIARDMQARLQSIAEMERTGGRNLTARSLELAAKAMTRLATASGESATIELEPPSAAEPWVYCGPLNTWSARTKRAACSLLVAEPDPVGQQAIDHVDQNLAEIRQLVDAALQGEAEMIDQIPGMHTTRLLLVGGESSYGHKNFAHFFPLETPGAVCGGPAFTVVFTNIHRERLARCSVPLLRDSGLSRAAAADQPAPPIEAVLQASLTWFRCHDLGHFWRAPGWQKRVRESTEPRSAGFEDMSLEETYADMLGLLCARTMADPEALQVAFGAEMVRYFSRSQSDFADSVAAMLAAGWFANQGLNLAGTADADPGELTRSAESLARTVAGLLWHGAADSVELKEALIAGQDLAAQVQDSCELIPTDLTYICG